MAKQIIHEPGLQLGTVGVISIDLSKWTTQALLTQKLNVSRNTVNNRVTRYEKRGTLRTFYIEQLGIKLIPNVNEISELGTPEK
jgi:hypothetical protein